MHAAVLVIGPEPEARAKKLVGGCKDSWENDPYAPVVWAAIGGRYSGNLKALPGATSGRVYGDALPSAEAAFSAAISGMSVTRPSHRGPDFDQVRAGELDIDAALLMPYLIDACDTVHEPLKLTVPEGQALYAENPEPWLLDPPPPGSPEVLASAHKKEQESEDRFRHVLRTANPDDLVTIVDLAI